MIALHPNILERDGEKAFAVLPYEEFKNIQTELEEFEDMKELRSAKSAEGTSATVSLSSVRHELNI